MDTTTIAIQVNIDALKALLLEAFIQAQGASSNMTKGQQNRAFGTLVGIEETLTKAQNLFGAALVLHQAQPAAQVTENDSDA